MHRALLLLGLAAVCLADDTGSPDAVLARLRERVLSGLQRLPNYTCVETIAREYFTPNSPRVPDSCDALLNPRYESSHKLLRTSLDRLRLDVAVTPEREIYSWAGAHQFETRDLTEIIGGGPIGTGAFGAFLMSVFRNKDAVFRFVGETRAGGRTLMEFAYRVPQEKSNYRIRTNVGWMVSGYDGKVLADPGANDLVQLSIRTEELPPETGSCETRTTLDYHRVAIGDAEFLLPRQTTQRFILRNGIETENVTTFSACREYRGQATIRYMEDAANAPADPHRAAAPLEPLPSGRPVAMEFIAPLDTWTASAGDIVGLRLAKPIVDSHRRVLAPAGAAVEARLIRVQRYFIRPEYSTIVLKAETIERNGVRQPFPVHPDFHPMPPLNRTSLQMRSIFMREPRLPNEVNLGVLQVAGYHVILPKGYRTDWLTTLEKP